MKKRKEYTSNLENLSKGSEEYRKLDALQRGVKGTVNTLYGTTASPYFDISSPCVANNITDMARSACWMMSKASNGLKSITDGCESFLNRAHYIPGNKGASFKKLSKKKGLTASPLGSRRGFSTPKVKRLNARNLHTTFNNLKTKWVTFINNTY